jgi:hypothetical protein
MVPGLVSPLVTPDAEWRTSYGHSSKGAWSQQFSDQPSMPEVVESIEASGFGH